MKSYLHVAEVVFGQVWAITPEKFAVVQEAMLRILAGDPPSDEEIAAIVAARPQRTPPQAGAAVAILPLHGTIAHRAGGIEESSGGTSTERFGAAFRQVVNDPSVSAVVLDVDSPGGTVAGVPELADQIHAARGRKPIVAVVDGVGASAAYWLASAASEVVAAPSAQVGSIGVLTSHTDVSKALAMRGVTTTVMTYGKHKAEGSPYGPLADETRAHVQEQLDYYGGLFDRAVARGRCVPVATVRADFGQGRVYHAARAKQLGMIDRVGSLGDVVQELASGKWQPPMRAEEAAIVIEGGVVDAPRPSGPSRDVRLRRLRHLAP